jgi:DNA-binding response OmpR family regulator
VVVLTASGEHEDIIRAHEAGANAYVRKPVEFTDFAAAARTIALFWLELAELPTSQGRGS